NYKLRPRQIKADSLVLKKTENSDPTRSRGKLAPNWKGPYQVESTTQLGTYTLATMEGNSCRERGTSRTYKNFMYNMTCN
ncbi:hypothetical protein B296_00014802, partial [Ensete ventricosum]